MLYEFRWKEPTAEPAPKKVPKPAYHDPTADKAIDNVMREQKAKRRVK